ncbi:HEAT repeat domain-containing protein [[Scytonema hofmanni] UTEX B 1581]|uniref:HEAT repeat domain-containing protein n=1 Tax=[Scytonema hofmanni] UTEX B 1581 TaxID=379535 RepID=UPI0021B10A5B|nr:HEAT repeat domain-containing protein [[Scytonema hofmanni] UTEX B 1581]
MKWTEPAALMLGLLDDEGLALRVVRLALQVDWNLGARLAGEVKFKWQKQTVGLFESLNFSVLLKIKFLEETKSEAAIPGLIKLLEDKDSSVRWNVASALAKIKSEAAIPGLIKLLEDKDSSVGRNAA